MCRGRSRRCSTIYAVAATGTLLLCAWSSSLLIKYTPLFKKFECEAQVEANLRRAGVDITMRCANFSPLAFEIEEGEPGLVWFDIDKIGSEEERDGSVVPVATTCPAHGLGDMAVRINFDGDKLSYQEPGAIYMRFKRKMYLHIPGALFFLSSRHIVEDQWCGVKFQSLHRVEFQSLHRQGALTCKRSKKELQDDEWKPAVEKQHVVIEAAELGLEELENDKSLILMASIIITYTYGMAFVVCACGMAFKAGNEEGVAMTKCDKAGEPQAAPDLAPTEEEEDTVVPLALKETEDPWDNHVTEL